MGLLRTCFLILSLLGVYASAQSRYSYKCDFEDGIICSFLTNDQYNKENWKIGSGKSNSADSGPSVDHTLGNANGTYLYVNVSRAKKNAVKIQSVVLKGDYCIRFFYHMYGSDIGELTVNALSILSSYTFKYFYRSRTQGDRWKEAVFSVRPNSYMTYQGYRIIFTAENNTSSNVNGDIALDDIEFTVGRCPESKADAGVVCTFDDYDCGYKASRTSSISWDWQTQNRSTSYQGTLPSVDHTLGTIMGGYWFSGFKSGWISTLNSSEYAILSSPVYEKPKTSTNCIHFYFYVDGDGKSVFWGSVKEAFVQVYLNFPESKNSRVWLATKAKNATYHRQWTYVETRADITEKYQLQFTAFIDSPVFALVAIDDIKLVPGNCPEAVTATHPPVTTTEMSMTTTRPPATTTNMPMTTTRPPATTTNMPNLCIWNPCGNNGTCRGDGYAYRCTCKVPYYGERCEKGPCTTNPCHNNGTCSVDGYAYKCSCKVPYSGETCQEGPCTRNPCHNNGTCSVDGSAYKCSCKLPYSGETCQEGPCARNLCQNNGTCSYDGFSYKCSCRSPYFGKMCQKGPCTRNPCLNDGTCSVDGYSFKCTCKTPYYGRVCQKDICSKKTCKHGECEIDGDDYYCRCEEGFTGRHCDERVQFKIRDSNLLIVVTVFCSIFVCFMFAIVCLVLRRRRLDK